MHSLGSVLVVAAALLVCGPGARAQGAGAALQQAAALARSRNWIELQRIAQAAARAEPGNAAAHYWLGRARAGQGDADGARAGFKRAVALAPNSSEYNLWLGRTYCDAAMQASVFSRLSLAKKCKAQFERAAALDPGSYDAHLALMSYHLQAPGIAGGSRETALAEAQTLRRLQPYSGTFQVQRVLLATGRGDQAIAEMRALATAYPDSSGPVSQLAVMFGDRKQFDAAFAAVDAFLKSHPRDRGALYSLGRAAAVSGRRLDEGEAALRQYLAGDPLPGLPPGGPHWRLGMIEQARGRNDDARREYEIAASLQPKDPSIRKSLDALRR